MGGSVEVLCIPLRILVEVAGSEYLLLDRCSAAPCLIKCRQHALRQAPARAGVPSPGDSQQWSVDMAVASLCEPVLSVADGV